MQNARSTFLADIALENAGVAKLAKGITTLGHTFLPGEFRPEATLQAQFAHTTENVQVDVKTRYADGSVKMAVLTLERPALQAGESVDIALVPVVAGRASPVLDLAGLSRAHDFTVDLAIQGGEHIRLDLLAALRNAIADGSASSWQHGALATQARVEIALPGSQRIVADITAFSTGGLIVDAQFNNDRAMEAVGGRVVYDLTVRMDGQTALQQIVEQAQYQNWHHSFSSTATDGGQGLGEPADGWLNIRQDITGLETVGAVATYDPDLTLDQRLLTALANDSASSSWDAPLATRGVGTYMPQTGGRGDIGITTLGNTSWLISQDAGAARYALGQAETAAVVPWHFWNEAGGAWINTDAYPKLWTDWRGGTGTPGDAASTGLTQQVGGASGWTTDTAHQPDLSYVPYLLTGQRWLLDEVQAQASFNTIAAWPLARGDAADNVVNQNQVRGAAWGLRALEEAAWSSPDGSAGKAFFTQSVHENMAWMVAQIPAWTAAQGEAHGWIPGDYGTSGAMPPWQQDYFASVIIAAATRGDADALTLLNWQANFLVGRFTHGAQGFQPHDGAAYLIATGDPSTGQLYRSWAEIGAATEARGWSNGTGWSHSQGDYPQLALATLAGIWRLTGSQEARDAYVRLVAEGAPFSDTSDYARDPTFAIAGPISHASTDTTATTSPPPTSLPAADIHGVTVTLSAHGGAGHPVAVIEVDGAVRFSGAITAEHGQATELHGLGILSRDQDHLITIRFDDQAAAGDSLFIDGLVVDGAAVAATAAVPQQGSVELHLPALRPQPVGVNQLRVALSADNWRGAPHYIVLIDGEQQDGVRSVSAPHAAAATEVITLTGDFSSHGSTVTVRFLDDEWGGTAATDRNLYVEGMWLDGVDQGQSAALLRTGDAVFQIAPAGQLPTLRVVDTLHVTPVNDVPSPASIPPASIPPASIPPASTPSVTIPPVAAPAPTSTIPSATSQPAGPHQLAVALSADNWHGAPHYLVLIDGQQQGPERSVSAEHAQGASQLITLSGDFASHAAAVTIRFLNDEWGGSAAADRNLYVEGMWLDGVDQGKSAALLNAGDVLFALAPAGQSPAVVLAPRFGEGPDTLRLTISEDATLSHARFEILVDGVQMDGPQEVHAARSDGATQAWEVHGHFIDGQYAGPHQLQLRMLDAPLGADILDSPVLHLEHFTLNGSDQHAQIALHPSAEVFFSF